ncbi:MAG: LuxR C-terminal-related transcriptional regulator [Cyanobacteriota bacterium]
MADHPSPDLNEGDRLRFVPASEGFQRRNRLADALLSHWTLVAGGGSWLEAHLAARLGRALGLPNLLGCGIDAAEVWELVAQVPPEQPLLVLLSDSIAADQGRSLIARLRRQRPGLQVLLLVQHEPWLSAEALEGMQAQAIVHVESFGSGTLIRALQALRHGQTFLDPRLRERLQQQAAITLSGREQQVLAGLSRGLTNRAIALESGIAATTVRDYVSSLIRKLGAGNRTEVLSRALDLGLIRERGPGR